MSERAIAGALRATKNTATTGEIEGTLATSGEASDGDILHIPGGTVEPGIPLLFGHDTLPIGDALRHLGSWQSFTKTSDAIEGKARIEIEHGEGASLEFRRDVAAMIEAGHLNGLSIRWEPTKQPKRRVNLPSDHYAFVDADSESDPRKRYGYFYPEWRALEGSVVTLGADRQAMIARAWNSKAGETWADLLKAEDRAEIRAEVMAELEAMLAAPPRRSQSFSSSGLRRARTCPTSCSSELPGATFHRSTMRPSPFRQ